MTTIRTDDDPTIKTSYTDGQPSAASAGYEIGGAIRTEGFATTEFNLALPVEGPALSKAMMYDIILIPKKQY